MRLSLNLPAGPMAGALNGGDRDDGAPAAVPDLDAACGVARGQDPGDLFEARVAPRGLLLVAAHAVLPQGEQRYHQDRACTRACFPHSPSAEEGGTFLCLCQRMPCCHRCSSATT